MRDISNVTFQVTKEELEDYYWIKQHQEKKALEKSLASGQMQLGGESVKPVLLFLLVAVAFALASDTPLMSVLVGAPILVIGFALVSCVAGVLFGGVGVVALIIFAVLSLLA